jgi:hypothetical protein
MQMVLEFSLMSLAQTERFTSYEKREKSRYYSLPQLAVANNVIA